MTYNSDNLTPNIDTRNINIAPSSKEMTEEKIKEVVDSVSDLIENNRIIEEKIKKEG